jgi:alpha-D-ribose 1-methylphosphonate 5-phosphate C-P lyase
MTRTTKQTTKPTPNANKVSVNTNKVKVNKNKVDINAAKVRANAAKVAANAAKVKANAKAAAVAAPAKVTNTKTTVVTPKKLAPVKAKADTMPVRNTTPKDYEIVTKHGLDRMGALYVGSGLYGTKAQQDSSIASVTKYNVKAPGRYWVTKSSYRPGDEGLAKAAKKSRIDYVPPKNTNSGPLRNRPQTKTSQEELYKRYQ